MSTKSLNPEHVASVLRNTGSVAAAARELKLSRSTLRGYVERNNLTTYSSDEHVRSIMSVSPSEWSSVQDLIVLNGLVPQEFEVRNIRLNHYGDNYQTRVDLVPLTSMLQPARTEGWKPPKKARHTKVKQGLIFFFGDQHVPHHDPSLHAIACQMLREHKPEQLILVGDLLDYAAVSRWRKSGDEAKLQETVDLAWGVLRDYVEASPGTTVKFLDGNHEERLANSLKDKGHGQVATLRRPGDAHPLLSTAHILRFDELGIEQVFPPEGAGYQQTEIKVLPDLAARHGGAIKKDSGASGMAALKKLRRNIVIGDTHRQSITYHTWWDIENKPHRLVAAETGTMAAVDYTGLNYAPEPDWMQGFATAQDLGGVFSLDLAVYSEGKLAWRDYLYEM